MKRVAVLGAGIMGSSVALFLARRGVSVTLFDRAAEPFTGASRWNEGKIHLGYLYAADPSLKTARRLLPGGLAFHELATDLIGCSLDRAISPQDETYLIHRESVIGAEAAERYFREVNHMVRSQPAVGRYLSKVTAARRLSQAELDADYDTTQIVAGFRVPERSVSTRWLADRFVCALMAEPRIEQRMRTTIRRVRRSGAGNGSRLFVESSETADGPFDFVVNALWEGRLAIDAALGVPLPARWSHRFRLSAFVETSYDVAVPSTVVSTGPFGDVKHYNGNDYYLSWYTTGLLAEGSAIEPPRLPSLHPDERARIVRGMIDRLACIIPQVAALGTCADQCHLEGGWVYAAGQGSLCDPGSTLHRRDLIGITRCGSYISVDTGKYSTAPWLAREIASMICPSD